jgi:murein DD-endopeptidase MepM/ murein hydrolase activator NlpD
MMRARAYLLSIPFRTASVSDRPSIFLRLVAERLLWSLTACLFLIGPCSALTVSNVVVSRAVDQNSCSTPKSAAAFDMADREAFAWFRAQRLTAGDELRLEWLAPDGSVALDAVYHDLPTASSLCFASRLPIAGFNYVSQPGVWKVRVVAGERTLAERDFRITGEAGGLRVTSVRRSSNASGFELTIDGAGFGDESMVHIAQYTKTGGWRYLSAAQPRVATATQLVIDHQALAPAEYLVIIRNGDGQISRPTPFVIETGGYKLPMIAGEPWIITQGPYGSVSHWGNTLHGFDIAPRGGRCVVAMKAGIAHVHDRGMSQNRRTRTFGNYIDIDHGDGEYSHYAHLATGTFVVSEGQYVEQGQALAVVGNSGYTLGEGGGYHIHVQVSRSLNIASNSVPFVFEDMQGPLRKQMPVVSTNSSAKCDCGVRARDAVFASTAVKPSAAKSAVPADPQFTGHLGFSEWWTQLVSVPARAPSFEATLTWPQRDAGFDLHLMSPSGHHYAWYADATGYSGSNDGPQQFRIPNPEAGTWRVSVQAVRGGAGQVAFEVTTSGLKPGQRQPETARTTRRASVNTVKSRNVGF